MRFEIWFICSVLLFICSILAIFAAVWIAKHQNQRDPRWDNTYPCMVCKQGEMVGVDKLTESKLRYICTNCGAEEVIYLNKETF